VAFSLSAGQVSEVIETADAFQLIQLVERTGSGASEAVHLRQIYMKVESGGDTVEKVRLAAEEIRKSAQSVGLRQAAADAGLVLRSTGPFEEGSFLPGIGEFRGANLFAFASPLGEISEPVFNNNTYFLLSVAARDSSQVEPFEAVTGKLREMVGREKRLELAKAEANRLRGETASGLETLARKAGREVRRADLVTRVGAVPAIGRDTKLILAAFSTADGATAGPIHTEHGSFYIRRERVTPVDEQRYLTERAYLTRSLLAQRQEYLFSLWVQRERERASVKDMRPETAEMEEAG
jgi:hypothetical protein